MSNKAAFEYQQRVFILVQVASPICLLPFSFLGPRFELHCSLCALDFLGEFTSSGALDILLGELVLSVEFSSLLGVASVPCKQMGYLNKSIKVHCISFSMQIKLLN